MTKTNVFLVASANKYVQWMSMLLIIPESEKMEQSAFCALNVREAVQRAHYKVYIAEEFTRRIDLWVI